jgi:hypothetical protein
MRFAASRSMEEPGRRHRRKKRRTSRFPWARARRLLVGLALHTAYALVLMALTLLVMHCA